MLKVLKTENGVSILDFDELVKINIEEKSMSDSNCTIDERDGYRVEFDTRLHDLLRGDVNPFVNWVEVSKATDLELAEVLGDLFNGARNYLRENEDAIKKMKSQAQLRYLYKDNEEVTYYSEDSCNDVGTKLILQNVDKRGYLLGFAKATRGLGKLDFWIKRNYGREPELADLYCRCFSQIMDLAEYGYDDYNDELMEHFLERKKSKIEEKRLIKKHGR